MKDLLEVNNVHLWEKSEIVLEAQNSYPNPYTDVKVWVDLEGPHFEKRIYGFWDGGNVFRVRVVATAPGKWEWRSGSDRSDPGLRGKSGTFEAMEWTAEEKEENLCRRGFIRTSENRHALEHADGTPFFLLGDTWWATPSFRFRWYEEEKERSIGPEMGFKEMVRYRKKQGFNSVALIASHPAWANDGYPATIRLEDEEETVVRDAWPQPGSESAEDMHNEGGRPFLFPGKVPGYEDVFPDVDRINPDYFRHLDKKIDYLNSQGFVPFIEVARRDVSQAWKKFYDWPQSYVRYIQYVFSRYGANNCILSPIHFDTDYMSIPSREYNDPANLVFEEYGPPPFGNLISTNAHLSNFRNFGGPEEARWLSLYQVGNFSREHFQYWHLSEIFDLPEPKPVLNGEPYYAGCPLGWPHDEPPNGPEEDALYCRSAMYGSVLCGGLAGHIYGAQGLWEGAVEEEADPQMWESLTWESGAQMEYLKKFVLSEGERYQELVPRREFLTPNKSGDHIGYTGWAYCAGTADRDFFLLYFEKDCPQATFRGSLPGTNYRARWFNPRRGEWIDLGDQLQGDESTGLIELPRPPSNEDWGMKLLQVA